MPLFPFVLSMALVGGEHAEPRPFDPAAFAWFQDAEDEALGVWTGAVSAGITLTSGNSNTITGSLTFDAERRGEDDRWTFNALANYTEQTVKTVSGGPPPAAVTVTDDDETTANNYSAKAQYDRFFSEETYGYVHAAGERDDIALLQLRATLGAGVGYQFFEREDASLNGEVGLTGVHEDLEGESPNEFGAIRLAYNAFRQLTANTKFTQGGELLPSLKDSDDWTASLDTGVDVSVTEAMFLRIQHVLDYDNSPARGFAVGVGDGAQKADHRVILTLGWSF